MKDIKLQKITAADIPNCTSILRNLPQWFGIEAAIIEIERNLAALDGFVAKFEGVIVGFVGLKRYGRFSIEIDIMSISPTLRRRGIGTLLLQHVEAHATTEDIKLFHLKTLAPSDPDPNYAETRAFWESQGFIPMDADERWGPDNPCQIMVKPFL